MAEYLTIKNWEKYQHYKDRSPPWIKLHRELLDDYEMACLQDASKLHLILIWVLSSQLNNRIPNDPEWVSKKIGATSKVNLKELIDKGFLILEQSASSTLAKCSPETETYREEIDKEKNIKKEIPEKVNLENLSVDHNASWLAEKRSQGRYLYHDEHFILEQFKQYCRANGVKYKDYVDAYRNSFEWDKCKPRIANADGKPNKSDRAKTAIIDGLQQYHDSLSR